MKKNKQKFFLKNNNKNFKKWEKKRKGNTMWVKKKLQSEIFNQLNIKKVKLTKIILKKKNKKEGESTVGKTKKKKK